MPQKIRPFLWFDTGALEAAEFYVSLFPHSEVLSVTRWGEGGPMPAGLPMTVEFSLEGVQVTALNAGPQFPHTEAFSFSVTADDQTELDRLWDALIADGGEESMCGWLKDRWGLSWQIVPAGLDDVIAGRDPAKAGAAMAAMMKMRKLDIGVLRAAYEAG